MDNGQSVSFEDEELILVNDNDDIIGYKSKAECHDGDGILHRAFSIFIFNSSKQVLMQKRSIKKRLWPLFWSNSCCSHPRKSEDNEFATQRRLKEELGIHTPLKFIFKFQYHAKLDNKGAEHENCSVYIGKTDKEIIANPDEIAEWKFFDLSELADELLRHPESFTPWFKIEWKRILENHIQDIDRM